MRVLSALNMAQVDILAQASGLPLYGLLRGKTRPRVRVYNTTTDYWAINNMKMGPNTLAILRFLLDRGITGIKIYPFTAPEKYLSNEALERGLEMDKGDPRQRRQPYGYLRGLLGKFRLSERRTDR